MAQVMGIDKRCRASAVDKQRISGISVCLRMSRQSQLLMGDARTASTPFLRPKLNEEEGTGLGLSVVDDFIKGVARRNYYR